MSDSKPRRRRFSTGQMKMGLAAELHRAGLRADIAFAAALDIIETTAVPPKWRERLGPEISDAIDADLRDPHTWLRHG